jgi:hypothetical protein
MGLDPYVVQSTKILCSKFTIPEDTERELSAAWQTQSDEYPGEDNAREILLGLVASKQGSVFAGICTAIDKYYHRDTVPTVLETVRKWLRCGMT